MQQSACHNTYEQHVIHAKCKSKYVGKQNINRYRFDKILYIYQFFVIFLNTGFH